MNFAGWLGGTPPGQWREDFLIEHVRSDRGDTLRYAGQVSDGDQIRFLYGDWRSEPRPSVLFEFDDGGGVGPGAVAVPIGADPDATFAALADAVLETIPFAYGIVNPTRDQVNFVYNSPQHYGLYLLVERNQAGAITHQYPGADFFGVRDVANGFTYVEHETGELELYDFATDPSQLESKAADANYAATRARLAERLGDLLQ
jgi:hypothetical protein